MSDTLVLLRDIIMDPDPVTAEGWESRITHRAAGREEP